MSTRVNIAAITHGLLKIINARREFFEFFELRARRAARKWWRAMGRAVDAPPEIEIEWGGAHSGGTRDFGALHYLFGGMWLLGFLACAVRCALNPRRNICLEPPAHQD